MRGKPTTMIPLETEARRMTSDTWKMIKFARATFLGGGVSMSVAVAVAALRVLEMDAGCCAGTVWLSRGFTTRSSPLDRE